MLIRRCLLHFPRGRNLKANATFLNKTPDPESVELEGTVLGGSTAEPSHRKSPLLGRVGEFITDATLLGALLALDLSGPRVDKNLFL